MEIRIKDIKKSYHDHIVLDIDDLTIKSGRITAIVGPNGAGKSTLLHVIAQMIEKDSGQVYYNESLKPPLLDMTLVFQEPYLIHSTVYQNIAYPLKIRKQPLEMIQQRIETLAKELNMTHLLKKQSNQLSLGEAQKVALARALSFQPKILLLDEPTASLDPYTTSEIERILKKMKDSHMTIVFITHQLAQAKRIGDDIILLSHGKIVENGECEQFFYHPKQEQTKKFIEGELLIDYETITN